MAGFAHRIGTSVKIRKNNRGLMVRTGLRLTLTRGQDSRITFSIPDGWVQEVLILLLLSRFPEVITDRRAGFLARWEQDGKADS